MKIFLKISALICIILTINSPVAISKTRNVPLIGTLDINSQETGGDIGAGCFFYTSKNNTKSYVFVDRAGFAWIHVNNKIEKLKRINEFVMWPSKKGDELDLVYKSDQIQVELSIAVSSGCKEYEDNCATVYDGTLSLYLNDIETVLKVKGRCGC